ncbi:MAG: hypothetical protein ACR2M8_10590 [Pyrinomonadaceae bacterium]|nr:hypothetical protein [Acidobacteriota bacterium]
MKKKYKNEGEISRLVRSFEYGTVSRDEWKHAEHLVVALYYISIYDIDTATEKMRHGILNLLRAFEIDLKKEMPYHETLTVFWMRTIADFNSSKNGDSLLDKANEVVGKYDKDYPLLFYSRDYLFSDEARASFVIGDLF